MAGCGAVGSALRSGRRGRRFESCHPDKCGEGGCSKTIEQPFFYYKFSRFFSHAVKYFHYLCRRKINKKGVLHCRLRLYPRT